MAKVKIQGNASGTGVITLIAPNTNTDRTVTLPDESITLGGGVDGIVSTADATAITIDSSENVGIGVVPETDWSSNHSALQISQTGAMFGRDSAMQSGFLNNARITGGDYTTSKYIIADQASVQVQRREGFFFYTAPSGSADAAITWTKQLHITDDGRGLSQFTAKAWCNINQSGTQNFQDGHNVSSVSDQGVGNSLVFFTNSMSNDYYSTVMSSEYNSFQGIVQQLTGTVQVAIMNTSNNYEDRDNVNIVVFGD